MKVIQEDLSKWKKILFSQVVVLNVFKLVILPKLSYGFNGILIKTPTDFFYGTWEANFQMYLGKLRSEERKDNVE